MNLRDLEYLVAVDRFRHFRKAAESCFVSQPTLSGQLKKLEEDLGVQLMERSKRKVIFTPVGEEIVRRAKTLLAEAEAIRQTAQQHRNPMSGRVRLGLIPTVAPYLLPRVMDDLMGRFPELELLLIEAQTERCLAQLKEGQMDAAVLAFPMATPGCDCQMMYSEPFWVLVSAGHELADRSQVSLEDLADQALLLLEDGHCLREHALDVCFTSGAREMAHFRATSLETLRHMVAAGSGLTLLPQLAVPQRHREQGLVYLPFTEPAPSRDIGLIFRTNTSRRTCFETLAGAIAAGVGLPLKKAHT